MKILFKILLTINATSWFLILYAIKEQWVILGLSIWICGIMYLFFPVVLSLLSLFLFRFSGNDHLTACKELSLADNEFLPVYLGYFFLSVGINETETMIFVYFIICVFTYISQTQYFNPILLLLGYHYYHVLTPEGTKVFLIVRGKVIRNKNNICFDNLKRINDTTFLKRGKDREYS
ncbi:MAG TPA: hypothetical protein DEW35_04035 [Ruminococcaceae bacterium]|nr:hypothetical protein [Oscillospiraceae bacterium]